MKQGSGISCRVFRTFWKGKDEVAEKAKRRSVFMLCADIHKSSSFYDTNNIYIAGDNIEALKLLRNGYAGRIKVICIGTSSDKTKLQTHTDSKHDANAQLSMIYSRLLISAELLSNDGVLFIRVENDDIVNIRIMLDDIFGKKNYITQFGLQPYTEQQTESRIICYMKDMSQFNADKVLKSHEAAYKYFDASKNAHYKLQSLYKHSTNGINQDLYYAVTTPDGSQLYPTFKNGTSAHWRWDSDKLKSEMTAGNVEFINKDGMLQAYEKVYKTATVDIKQGRRRTKFKKLFTYKANDNSQPEDLIKFFTKTAGMRDGDIILDFFASSYTTAHTVMTQNAEDGIMRRFIMIQTPENTDINSEIYKAGYKDICDIETELINRGTERITLSPAPYAKEIDTGYKFYRIVPSTVIPI